MPPTVTPFRGPIDIADRLSNIHPQDWVREIYRYRPVGKSGKAMLTMHSAAYGSEKAESMVVNWWDEAFNQRGHAVVDVYTDILAPTGTPYVAGGVAGDTVMVAMTAANAKLWNQGDQIQLTNLTSNAYTTVVGRVSSVTVAGDTTSGVALTLLEADTDTVLAATGANLRCNPAGQSYSNTDQLPSGRYYEPRQRTNVCANFYGVCEMTDHEIKEASRVDPNAWPKAIMDAFDDLTVSMELGSLFSIRQMTDPRNYKMGGLKWWLNPTNGGTTAGRNIVNFLTDTTYLAATETGGPLNVGWDFLERIGEYLRRWVGGGTWKVYCGGLAMQAIRAMLTDKGWWEIKPNTDEYGFNFQRLVMQGGGTWELYEHPLFINEPAYQKMMVVCRPELLKKRVFFPLEYIPSKQMDMIREDKAKQDGTQWSPLNKAGWRVTETLRLNCPDAMAIINGFGLDCVRT